MSKSDPTTVSCAHGSGNGGSFNDLSVRSASKQSFDYLRASRYGRIHDPRAFQLLTVSRVWCGLQSRCDEDADGDD